MKQIPESAWLPGVKIQSIAAYLVLEAPARTVVNGIRVRAKYATTNARDVVNQFRRDLRARWGGR